jgi:excisionase family DNA binding protein
VSEFAQKDLSQRVCVAVLSFIQKRHGRWREALRELGVEIEGFLRDNADVISEENSAQSFMLRLEGGGRELPSESVPARKFRKNGNRMIDEQLVYTPNEVAQFAKCSPSFVRKEIKNKSLKAFRLGKLLRIKGEDACYWMSKSGNLDLAGSAERQRNSQVGNGAQSGAAKKTGVDTALASVWRERRP